jgi:hypothetical protein
MDRWRDGRPVAGLRVFRDWFLEKESGDARRRLEDKPPYLALGV